MDHRKDRIGSVLTPIPAPQAPNPVDVEQGPPNVHRKITPVSIDQNPFPVDVVDLFAKKLFFRVYAFGEWRGTRNVPQIILFLFNVHHVHRIAISTNVYRVEPPVDVVLKVHRTSTDVHRIPPLRTFGGPSPRASAGPLSPFNRYTNPRRKT